MGRIGRLVCGVAATVAALVTFAWPSAAAASTDGGIGLAVSAAQPAFRPGESVRLTVTVTNTSASACGLATTADGTVHVISVRRDGEELTPTLAPSLYEDGLGSAIAAGVVAAQPGSTVAFTLAGIQLADGTDPDSWVLRSVTATSSGTGLDMLWPVGAPGRYEVTARYAIPPVDSAVPPCAGAAAGTVTFAVGDAGDAGRWPGWLWLLAATLLALAIGVLVAVLLVRRRRRASAAAVLVILGVAAVLGAPGERAQAVVVISPYGGEPFEGDFPALVSACFASFTAPGGDPAGIIPHLQDLGTPPVRIVPVGGGSNWFGTGEGRYGAGSSTITWNPTSTASYGDGVARDPCSSLYHELVHAYDYSGGTYARQMCGDTGLPTAEVRATLEENRYRASQGLPPRTEYQGHSLPASIDECDGHASREPSDRGPTICAGEDSLDCGRTSGDPHLVTFDRLFYDFQAVGEFVLVRSTSGDPLEVQARQAPFGHSRSISVNSAVAFRIGDHRLSMVLSEGVSQMHLDGEPATLDRGDTALPGGGLVVRRDSDLGNADGYDIVWPDGSAAAVDQGDIGYRLLVRLDNGRAGAVEGLLGDFDGDPGNDLALPSGTVLAQPVAFADLYPSYADNWRITQEASLFTYADGENTGTFTDRAYPAQPLTLDGLDAAARARAELACQWAGVTDSWLFAECVFDVGVTGRPEFAVGTAGTEGVAPPAGAPIAATPIAAAALAPDGEERLTFTGRAGDVVFVDIFAPTLPSRCSPSRLLDPAGAVIGTGCIFGGSGTIDRTELAVDGEYSVLIEGYEDQTGGAMVRVYAAKDVDGTIEPDGTPVSGAVEQPGSVARYRFTGNAGMRVYLQASSGGPLSQCSPLRLLDAQGRTLTNGCFVNGAGRMEGAVLPADGVYTIVVDLVDRTIGTVTLRLFGTEDLVGSIAVDGPPVVATIDAPGAVARYSFHATAETAVTLEATDATLPGHCSPLQLEDVDGTTLSSGCLLNGEGGIGPTVLPTTGEYHIVVDPSGPATGSVTLSLLTGEPD